MRYNLNNKISVLNKMIGLGEEVVPEPFYEVPQNSATNFTKTLGLCELQPFGNTANNSKQTKNCKCPHCERMAKNFLYLESLIRSNYNPSNNCNVCHSSLQYLQYVNRSIMKEFGNNDSVVEVAKAFGHNNIKCKTKHPKRHATSNHLSSKSDANGHVRKQAVRANISKSGKKIAGNQSLKKNAIRSAKKSNRKLTFKKDSSNHSAVKDVSVQNTVTAVKVKKFKGLKSKTKSFLRQIKSKK